MRKLDLTGRKFGRLTAITVAGKGRGGLLWLCSCSCEEGKTVVVGVGSLRSGNTKSCGCLRREAASQRLLKHGESGGGPRPSKEYAVWKAMVGRCHRPTDAAADDYGNRGIRVCDRWRESFDAFLADMGRCPPGYSIERKDNNSGYSPDNCVWADRVTQANNRRNSLKVRLGGVWKPLKQWAEEKGLKYTTVYRRYRRGDRGAKLFRETDTNRGGLRKE